MLNVRKILVPVDFSETSTQAVEYARATAGFYAAELTLLHVLPPLSLEFAMAQHTEDRYHELLGRRRDHYERQLAGCALPIESGEKIHREIAEGDAAAEILTRAHHGAFDLIVMSTRGAGPLRRWLLVGSVTTKVLYGAECPVISSPCFDSDSSPVPPRHILCAVDLGAHSERALRCASAAAERFGAGLTVVHATSMGGDPMPEMLDEGVRSKLYERLKERISSLTARVGVNAEIVIDAGDPPKVIAAVARRLNAGMVVQGRGSSIDLIGRLRASGYDIIRESPCPVVTV